MYYGCKEQRFFHYNGYHPAYDFETDCISDIGNEAWNCHQISRVQSRSQ